MITALAGITVLVRTVIYRFKRFAQNERYFTTEIFKAIEKQNMKILITTSLVTSPSLDFNDVGKKVERPNQTTVNRRRWLG